MPGRRGEGGSRGRALADVGLVLGALLSAGCPDGSQGATDGPEATGSSSSDASGDDTDDASTGGPAEVTWAFEPVRGNPNLDDDDGGGTRDWLELPFALDDDMVAVEVPSLPDGDEVQMTLTGAVERVRVWLDRAGGTPLLVLGSGNGVSTTENTLAPDVLLPEGAPTILWVEFGDYNARATMTLERRVDGETVDAAEVELRSSPLILTDHTRPVDALWIVEVPESCADVYPPSTLYVAGVQEALDGRAHVVPGGEFGCDRWLQDELEFAVSLDQHGTALHTVVDSIRDRGLDAAPEALWYGSDFAVGTWGGGQATTYDYFGNLEVSPPVTVDGVAYPYGRVYYGGHEDEAPHPDLTEFLTAQQLQRPFAVDSSWSCVGHVDEWISFIPDADAPRGFRMIYGDTGEAYALLDALDPALALPRYELEYGYATVGDLTGDAALRAYNEDVQRDHLTPIRARLIEELALTEDEILATPMLFEEISSIVCPGDATALIPALPNLVVANFDEGDAHVLMPDPFLRAALGDQDADPLIALMRERMPPTLALHFVDDWDSYHVLQGEVHCGADVRRAPPPGAWWDEAAHLLEP